MQSKTIRYILNLKAIVILMIGSFFFYSCLTKEKSNFEFINSINEGLINSNKFIHQQSVVIYKRLEEKLQDPTTRERTSVWRPKALLIGKISSNIASFIDSLATELDSFEESNKSMDLYDKLKDYKLMILGIDPELNNVFSNRLQILNKKFDQFEKNKNKFKNVFSTISTPEISNLLNTLLNNIAINENQMLSFCDQKTTTTYDGVTIFSILVGQNSTHFKPGEKLKISAGVGAYSMKCSPKVNVNGRSVKVEEGVAKYEMNVSGNVGKHTVPVSIEYINENGIIDQHKSEIEYYIDH